MTIWTGFCKSKPLRQQGGHPNILYPISCDKDVAKMTETFCCSSHNLHFSCVVFYQGEKIRKTPRKHSKTGCVADCDEHASVISNDVFLHFFLYEHDEHRRFGGVVGGFTGVKKYIPIRKRFYIFVEDLREICSALVSKWLNNHSSQLPLLRVVPLVNGGYSLLTRSWDVAPSGILGNWTLQVASFFTCFFCLFLGVEMPYIFFSCQQSTYRAPRNKT